MSIFDRDKEKRAAAEQAVMATVDKIERQPPRVRARERGQVNEAMESSVEALKKLYPGKHFRWVRMPEHKNDHLQLTRRATMGYKPVDRGKVAEEHGDNVVPVPFGGESGSLIRVGDVVLCWCEEEHYLEEKAFRDKLAEEEAKKSERVYRENVSGRARPEHLRATGRIERNTEDRTIHVGSSPE